MSIIYVEKEWLRNRHSSRIYDGAPVFGVGKEEGTQYRKSIPTQFILLSDYQSYKFCIFCLHINYRIISKRFFSSMSCEIVQ